MRVAVLGTGIMGTGMAHSLLRSGLDVTVWNRSSGRAAPLAADGARVAGTAAEAVGVPLPSGNVWRDRLVGAVAHGEAEHDWAVMAKDQARASGLVK